MVAAAVGVAAFAADQHPTSHPPAAPSDLDPPVPSQWQVGLISDTSRRAITAMRRTLNEMDSVPFRAGSLTEARLRDVLGNDLPGSFRVPVDLFDLVTNVSDWLKHDIYLLPDLTGLRPPQPKAANELSIAVDLGAIEICLSSSVDYFAPAFTVDQHGGKIRLIFDLRRLNDTLSSARFDDNGIQMETVYDVPSFLSGVKFACKVDLSKAFWQVPVRDNLARCMGVRLPRGQVGRWRVLPFGLSHAPRLFQTLTNAFVARWRRQGISVMGYLDDLLIGADDADVLVEHTRNILKDLNDAGIRVSSKKAYICPYERIEFLGILFDIPSRTMAIADDRLQRISDDAKQIYDDATATPGATVSTTDILALCGRIQFASFVQPLLVFHRSALLSSVSAAPVSQSRLSLSTDALDDLRWWIHDARQTLTDRWFPWDSPASIRVRARVTGADVVPEVVATLATDASETGVGYRLLSGELVGEPLPPDLMGASSTARELHGVVRVLETSSPSLPPGSSVRVLCDNQAVSSSVLGRSTSPEVARVGKRLLAVSMSSGVHVDVEWTPRELLEAEDSASRWSDGSLSFARPDPTWLRRAWSAAWGDGRLPTLELFSCSADRSCPDPIPYLSRVPMPGSVGEGLSSDWSRVDRGWAYPPFSLLRPIISRLASTHAPGVLWLLPDTPMVRHRLALSHSFHPGPEEVIAPSGTRVRLRSPLILCRPFPSPPARPIASAPPPSHPPTTLSSPSLPPSTTPTSVSIPGRTPTAPPSHPPLHLPLPPSAPIGSPSHHLMPTPPIASPSRQPAHTASPATSGSRLPAVPPLPRPPPRPPPATAAAPPLPHSSPASVATSATSLASSAPSRAAAASVPAATAPSAAHDSTATAPEATSAAAAAATTPPTDSFRWRAPAPSRTPPTAPAPAPPPTTASSPRPHLVEAYGDVFSHSTATHAFHCVSAHAEFGAGIARDVASICAADMPSIRAAARRLIRGPSFVPGAVKSPRSPPHCWWVHLVTKRQGSDYPTLTTIADALRIGFASVRSSPCNELVMPAIGCGIDGQRWPAVRPLVVAAAAACPRPDGHPWHITVYHW